MSVIKVLRDLNGLFNCSTDENPTSQQDYQKAVKNWVKTIVSLVDSNLWQPETEYTVGDTVKTPSLSKQALLLCITAGQSGAAEPDYTDVSSNDEITDGTVVWRVQTVTSQEKAETYTDVQVSAAVPTGVVQAFAGRTTPQGWLLCDGSAVSRTNYAALFNAIGTTYGSGDGSSTFNLPNLTDRFIEGNATAGTVKSAGLPNINGSVLFRGADNGGLAMSEIVPNDKGAFNVSSANTIYNAAYTTTVKGSGQYLYIDASRSSSVYGNSATVQPPALTMRYIIKY